MFKKIIKNDSLTTHTSGNKNRIRKSTLQCYSMCILPLIHVFVFAYLPMYGIILAFKNFRYDKGILGSAWAGLNNFRFFFESNTFGRLVKNTLTFNAIFLITIVIAEIAMAVLLYELSSKRKVKVFQTINILPYFMSILFVTQLVRMFLDTKYGFVNQLLEIFGLDRINFYITPEAWLIILPIVNIWKGVGMGCLYFYGVLVGIDPGLYESARLDGATEWQQIWYIMLPHLKPLVVLTLIMGVGNIFGGDSGLFYQVTLNQGALYEWTDTISTYIFRAVLDGNAVGVTTAIGFLQSLVGMILVLITNAIVRKVEPAMSLF